MTVIRMTKIAILRFSSATHKKLGELAHEFIPQKKLWMTETTGAQWNGNDWHTYGWTADLTEHQKSNSSCSLYAHNLCRCDNQCILWWGLIYSVVRATKKMKTFFRSIAMKG